VNQPVKATFQSPGSHAEYSVYWNGKTYGNGNQYLAVRSESGKEQKVVVNNGRAVEYSMSYGREWAEAAAKSVGLIHE
jgi:hypothetical protein